MRTIQFYNHLSIYYLYIIQLYFFIRYKTIIDSILKEIEAEYYKAIRFSILNYILRDPSELHRLRIQHLPMFNYPVAIISAPVPWHTDYTLSAEFIRHNWFSAHPILRRLYDLWTDR